MASARYFARRLAPSTAILRSLARGGGLICRTVLSQPVTTEVKNFTPLTCIRLKNSQEAQKFEIVNVQDEEDFKKRVLEASSSVPVVVDFHATWCGPCKLLGPRLEAIVSEEQGRIVMAKVDIDENSDLAMEYGVRSVPTVMAVKDGKIHSHFVGCVDDDKIRTFVEKLAVS